MQFSDKVLRVMKLEKISPEEMEVMVKQAAITSIRNLNRRYFHWGFRVEDDTVLDMQNTAEMLVIGTGEARRVMNHGLCKGQGCRACNYIGQIEWRT